MMFLNAAYPIYQKPHNAPKIVTNEMGDAITISNLPAKGIAREVRI